MEINVRNELMNFMEGRNIPTDNVQFPDVNVDADRIRVIMINEVPPHDPDDYFYSRSEQADYMKTVLPLFQNAGVDVKGIDDILKLGIYITTAFKSPKQGYAVAAEMISEHLPVLEYEIGLFPNVKVIMLMGDVAKKAFNMIVKSKTKKNAVPSGSTYKIRKDEFYYGSIRVFPSYIMTGGNILIEKSKCEMISDDIGRMMDIITGLL
jgi:uracil-DNA glycosylase